MRVVIVVLEFRGLWEKEKEKTIITAIDLNRLEKFYIIIFTKKKTVKSVKNNIYLIPR